MISDEKKAELDATAEERAAYLEEEKHFVAGVNEKHLRDKPEPYHANALTPACHVPGNVPTLPVVIDLNPGDTINADLSITPTADTPQQESEPVLAYDLAPVSDPAIPSAADLDAVAAEESAEEQTSGNA
jgi:hypothetical protein